jgi:hypothetical protein
MEQMLYVDKIDEFWVLGENNMEPFDSCLFKKGSF